MRSLFGKLRPNLRFTISFLAVTLLLTGVYRGDNVLSQTQGAPPFPPLPGQNGGRPPLGDNTDATQGPFTHHAWEEAAKKRNIERQNRLVADSEKIFQLAQQLSATVDTAKDPVPLGTAKKAEEIEKLARDVKDRMKSE